MAILQVTTSNTFAQWLVATQALIDKSNYYESTTNLVFTTANNVSNTANAVFITANNASNTANHINNAYDFANSIYIIANNAYNVANLAANTANAATANLFVVTAFNHANGAFDKANSVGSYANTTIFNHANGAFDKVNSVGSYANTTIFGRANSAFDRANTFVIIENSSNSNFYVPFLSTNTTMNPGVLSVSSTKLLYNPNTGTLQSVDFNSTSDLRLKENLKTISGLSTINEINPYEFTWKDSGKKSYGIIAQEIENILPELVMIREDGYKGISYIPLISILIQAVKELEQRIKVLEDK